MAKRLSPRTLIFSLIVLSILAAAPAAAGQPNRFRIDYTVKVASLENQLFHVTADVQNIREPRLDFSLPTWTPGWYTIENYAKNILRFHVTDPKGARLPHSMIRKQTWRVTTRGLSRIRIEFDYRADILALNQAKITNSFAFFTGIQLFVMAEGHRASPSTVRFEIPEGWKIASALKETLDPKTFVAHDYDTLVDSPTQMGNFDLTKFEIEGKLHYFIATPAGTFSKEKTEQFIEILTKIAAAQSAIFGGLPYEKYLYFYFFARPESNASGALEHSNSHIAFAPAGEVAKPEEMAGTASHEFFHTWNVKRIRPTEMWPYDYSRENYTPLLWVSEGLTNYYTNVALYRAGLRSREEFLDSVAGAIGGVENNKARAYISPADSSVSTWLGYDTPVAFGISYYTQGQNLGALLDLSIINDTRGASSLDDVMRALYKSFYKMGKGFSTEDLIQTINRLTKRDYRGFFNRYVRGVEVPPYDKILAHAGYRLEKSSEKEPVFDIEAGITPEGILVTRVPPSSPFARAGLEAGDLLLTIDGVEVRRGFRAVYERMKEKLGQAVRITIRREGQDKSLEMQVASREEVVYKIVELPGASPEQLKVRRAWLKPGK